MQSISFRGYNTILQEYELLVRVEDGNLPNNPFNYRESNLEINVQEYWLDILRNKNSSTGFKKLAKFMSSLCTIPHSNCFVERMFSIVSANKDKSWNLLEVSTVSTLLKVKSYYSEDEVLEVTKEHLELYRITIKNI